jgi:hypothetical protein
MMSHPSACPQSPRNGDEKQRFLCLLNQALNMADSLALPPEVGARLQEVIDLTKISIGRDNSLD